MSNEVWVRWTTPDGRAVTDTVFGLGDDEDIVDLRRAFVKQLSDIPLYDRIQSAAIKISETAGGAGCDLYDTTTATVSYYRRRKREQR